MGTASARLQWVADVAAPRPGDRVLEVGCGHGVLLGLLAGRATGGVVVGLDRSATMTTAAAARNRAAVEAGRVLLHTSALLDADLGEVRFDLVVAVHVGSFWRPPAGEYAAVRRLLAADGRLVLATQPLQPQEAAELAGQVEALAAPHRLAVRAVHTGATPPRPSIAVELGHADGSSVVERGGTCP